MMRMSNIKMQTVVDKGKLLAALRSNLANHSQIVQEARDGYIKQAQEDLKKRLELLRTGKIVSLQFSLSPPADHTEVYTNCIQMVEWTKQTEITLEADEFRQLVLDKWDWTESFLGTNRAYSTKAQVDFDGLSCGRGDY